MTEQYEYESEWDFDETDDDDDPEDDEDEYDDDDEEDDDEDDEEEDGEWEDHDSSGDEWGYEDNGYDSTDELGSEIYRRADGYPLRREDFFCLNDFFEICAMLWKSKRYCRCLRILADKVYCVDKREYKHLLNFLFRRVSDGAYANEVCTAVLSDDADSGILTVSVGARESGEVAQIEFARAQYLMPQTVNDAVAFEMLYEDTEAFFRCQEE